MSDLLYKICVGLKAILSQFFWTHFGLQNVFLAILGNDHFLFLLFINLEFSYNISKYIYG